jgi:membrane-bound serine protease (ClpP class)
MACGMVLLFAEVAIIPGFGVAGISSILLIGGGAFVAFTRYGVTWGMGSLLIAGSAAWAMLALAPRTRAGKQLILKESLKGARQADALLGKAGRAATALRPAGVAEIDGRRVDVVTDGVFVDAGRMVTVVSVEGARVLVAPAADGDSSI